MKILFATTNPAKIKYYAEELVKRGFEIITINDLNIKLDIDESGKNAVENACIKAEEYYNVAKILTIAIDDSLYIDGLIEEKQPGTNVRRVNGKRLNDDEMLEYYINLIKSLGGKVNANWVKGVAIYDGKEMKSFEYRRSSFFFVDKPSDIVMEGYPMDSLTIIPEFNKYLSELNEEELMIYRQKSSNKEIFEFILKSINEFGE